MTGDQAPDPRPLVIRGQPTPDEIAAVLAVLSAGTVGTAAEPDPGEAGTRPLSAWADPRRRVGTPLPHGAAGWRLSMAPR